MSEWQEKWQGKKKHMPTFINNYPKPVFSEEVRTQSMQIICPTVYLIILRKKLRGLKPINFLLQKRRSKSFHITKKAMLSIIGPAWEKTIMCDSSYNKEYI